MTQKILTRKEVVEFDIQFLQLLQDSLLDAYNSNKKCSPLIFLLSEATGFTLREVSDAFKYYGYFGRWSKMPFSKLLEDSNIDRKHWWNIYSLYERHAVQESFKKMYTYIADNLLQ